jgi:hypothetical protein
MRTRFVLACLFSLLLAGLLHGQSNRATITGTITDSTGAVVSKVEVLATNVETGVAAKSESNDSGIYSVFNLPPGTYSIAFAKAGFKEVKYPHITLIVAQVAELNPVLAVGAITEAITVTAEAPVLSTETATVETSMKGSVIADLPLNIYGGRQAESLAIAITPGYSPSSNAWTAVINGTQNFTKDYTVDGTTGSAQVQGDTIETGPSMEAVEEMHAQTSGLSAGSAATNGGVIMFNIKSGTNQFHGSALAFGHNEILDANTWDNNHTPNDAIPGSTYTRRAKSRFWDYAFSGGGPLIKNKTFIFGAFERFQVHDFTPQPFSSASTVPTTDFLNGNFAQLLDTGTVLGTDTHGNTIYQGAIFNPADPGAVFVGNVIPTAQISAVSQKIVALYQKYYSPENSDLIRNDRLPASNSPVYTPNQVVIKVDHNLRQDDRLSGSWVYNHRPRTLVDAGGIWSPGSTDGGPMATSRWQMVLGDEFRVSEAHTFTPQLLNVFNYTYNWFGNSYGPMGSTDWPSQLGFGSTGAKNFPVISFGGSVNGYGTTAIGNSYLGGYNAGTTVIGDQLTWTRGKHAVTFGGDFRAMLLNSHSGSGVLTFDFNPHTTAAAATSGFQSVTGFGFASFLLGGVNTASELTPLNLHGRRKAMSLFAQDDYKVRRDLTLNLGLRWDATFRYHEKDGRWSNFNLTKIDPNYGTAGAMEYASSGSDSFEREQSWTNFAPQIGFAYNPWSKVVFRGSFGMTYVPIGIQYWEGVPYGFDPGYRDTNSVSTAFNWDGGYPGTDVAPSKSTTPYAYQTIASIDPRSLKAGYTENYNVGVQYQIDAKTRIEASYVGNRGHRLHDSTLTYNETDPKTYFNLVNSGHNWDWVWDAASAAAAGVPYPYAGFSDYAFLATAPHVQLAEASYWMSWPNLYVVGVPKGQSYYDSFVVELARRFGGSVSFDFNYVLSQQKGDTNSNFGETYAYGGIQDYTNLKEAAQTLSSYDQKHVFKGYVVYQLPFGHGQRFLGGAGRVVNSAVSGWSVSGLVGYASGAPLTFTSNLTNKDYAWPSWATLYTDYNLAGYNGRKFSPSQYVVPTASNPTPASDLYFPTTTVTNPAYGQLGTGPTRIGTLRGFGQSNENASLLKYFSMGHDGQYKLSLRVEFYNIFNRHGFANPITDMNSAQFGYVPGVSGTPRNGQFGARFQW